MKKWFNELFIEDVVSKNSRVAQTLVVTQTIEQRKYSEAVRNE